MTTDSTMATGESSMDASGGGEDMAPVDEMGDGAGEPPAMLQQPDGEAQGISAEAGGWF